MKTKTRRRKIQKPVKIVVNNYRPAPPDVCAICGAAAYALWIDWDTMKRHCWCKEHEERVKASAPESVQYNYRIKHRPPADYLTGPNEIEAVIHTPGQNPNIIRGKNAQYCYDAWTESVNRTDYDKVALLYKFPPQKIFLVFDSDGIFHGKAKTRGHAEELAGKDRVILWWGGR